MNTILTVRASNGEEDLLAGLVGTLAQRYRLVGFGQPADVAWLDGSAPAWPALVDEAVSGGVRAVIVHRPAAVDPANLVQLAAAPIPVVLLGRATHAPAGRALLERGVLPAKRVDLVSLVTGVEAAGGERSAVLDLLLTLGVYGLAPDRLDSVAATPRGVIVEGPLGEGRIHATAVHMIGACANTRMAVLLPGRHIELAAGPSTTAAPGWACVTSADGQDSPPTDYEPPGRLALQDVWHSVVHRRPPPSGLHGHRRAFSLAYDAPLLTQNPTPIRAWAGS
ncbi:MAG: hypothetical protein LBJ08_00495 [Bifidobacteriaceae bacterium]|nr:hypothetical protein [Bifidobacteriaceae bacterium]